MLRLLLIVASLAVWEGAVRSARDSGLHPAAAVECISRALSRLRERALRRSHLDHAQRDAARLRARHGARLRARHRGRAVAPGRIFPLSVHRHVPGDAEGRACAADHRVVRTGHTSKVVNAALVAFFPLMVNTIVGLRSAEEDRVNLMRSLAATRDADLLDAAAAERHALHLRRAGDRDDLRADRRDRRRIRRRHSPDSAC